MEALGRSRLVFGAPHEPALSTEGVLTRADFHLRSETNDGAQHVPSHRVRATSRRKRVRRRICTASTERATPTLGGMLDQHLPSRPPPSERGRTRRDMRPGKRCATSSPLQAARSSRRFDTRSCGRSAVRCSKALRRRCYQVLLSLGIETRSHRETRRGTACRRARTAETPSSHTVPHRLQEGYPITHPLTSRIGPSVPNRA